MESLRSEEQLQQGGDIPGEGGSRRRGGRGGSGGGGADKGSRIISSDVRSMKIEEW